MKVYLLPGTLFIMLALFFGTVYGVAQQSLRGSANDPQIQIAQDAAYALDRDATPASLITQKVDANVSLAPFTTIYDLNGGVVANNSYIGLQPTPAIPYGVLQHAANAYNAVTWQPQPGVRLAAVAVKSRNYYVVSARSLKETNKRIDAMSIVVAIGWVLSMLILCGSYLLYKLLADVNHS